MKIDGNAIAADMLGDIGVVASVMQKRVCFIQLGDDAATAQFIARKQRVANQMGIQTDVVHESMITTTEEALAVIEDILTHEYDGIVVQLPLPYGIDTDAVLNAIPVAADIDVLSKESLEAFERNQTERMPPVAGAVDAVIQAQSIDLADKKIVIIGKGKLVGAPIALLFDRQNVPYAAIDVDTPETRRKKLLLAADIVISGTGAPHSVLPGMVKDGAVLIDAGTSEHNGKLVGDIDPSCYEKASLYTPTPGGIGPITVAILLKNLFRS